METTKQQRYYKSHKEIISAQKKQYYIDNKEKIQARKKEKYTCSCGVTITAHSKFTHEQSEKHKQNKPLKPKTIICDSCHYEYKNIPCCKKKHDNSTRHRSPLRYRATYEYDHTQNLPIVPL